jgi:hypothetical protein
LLNKFLLNFHLVSLLFLWSLWKCFSPWISSSCDLHENQEAELRISPCFLLIRETPHLVTRGSGVRALGSHIAYERKTLWLQLRPEAELEGAEGRLSGLAKLLKAPRWKEHTAPSEGGAAGAQPVQKVEAPSMHQALLCSQDEGFAVSAGPSGTWDAVTS